MTRTAWTAPTVKPLPFLLEVDDGNPHENLRRFDTLAEAREAWRKANASVVSGFLLMARVFDPTGRQFLYSDCYGDD